MPSWVIVANQGLATGITSRIVRGYVDFETPAQRYRCENFVPAGVTAIPPVYGGCVGEPRLEVTEW